MWQWCVGLESRFSKPTNFMTINDIWCLPPDRNCMFLLECGIFICTAVCESEAFSHGIVPSLHLSTKVILPGAERLPLIAYWGLEKRPGCSKSTPLTCMWVRRSSMASELEMRECSMESPIAGDDAGVWKQEKDKMITKYGDRFKTGGRPQQ